MTLNRLALLALPLVALARPAAAQEHPAERFVRDGVANAAASRDAGLALARDEAALARARALRLPSLSVLAQHVELAGGADIGALVNPAFAAINQLTGRNDLPTDLSFTFPLRQDARLRLAMPLVDFSIGAAVAGAEAVRDGRVAIAAATEHDLTLALQLGVLQHARAVEQLAVREAVQAALDEQSRVAERRAAEGVATPDEVLRARADRSEGAQRILVAREAVAAARRGVNRLARRPLDAAVPLPPPGGFAPALPATLADALVLARGRAELAAAGAGVRQADAGRRAARASALPVVSLAADAGWQGDRWRFTADQDVRQLTLTASWTPFQSGRDARRREEARLDAERAALAHEDLAELIALEVHDAWSARLTARGALEPATDRVAAARRAWELLRRAHAEGVATWLDLTTARAALTAAELDAVLARHALHEAEVRLARAVAATNPLPEPSR